MLLLLILIVAGRAKGDGGTKVALEKAGPHTIIEIVSASGKIYPETQVKISPEVSGEVTELNIEEGDSVHKGELLVRINPAIYNSIVTQASAGMQQSKMSSSNMRELSAQSKATYEQSLATFNRNKKLFDQKVISAQEFEQADATYKAAQANYNASLASASGGHYSVESAEAGLTQARENLRKTTIFAPTSGIISQLNIKKGERVVGTAQMAGTDILTIADMSRIEVQVDVSETDIAKVQIGDSTNVVADAYRNRKFKGIVSKISVSSTKTGAQLTTDQVTNYTVHILILPESYADLTAIQQKGKFPFKPGMSASVEIQTRKERNVLSVPVNAVTTRDMPDSVKEKMKASGDESDIRQVVFVYNEKDKTVAVRDVKTGIQDNESIQITEGLKDGEQVVSAPYGAIARTLKDKEKVQAVKKEQIFEAKKE